MAVMAWAALSLFFVVSGLFSFLFMLYNVLSCRPLQTLIPLVLCCYMSVDLKLKLKYISFITGHYWQWAGAGLNNKDFLYGAIP